MKPQSNNNNDSNDIQESPILSLRKVFPLQNPSLLSYLESHGINLQIEKTLLKEIIIHHGNMNETFRTIGWFKEWLLKIFLKKKSYIIVTSLFLNGIVTTTKHIKIFTDNQLFLYTIYRNS